MGLNSTPGAERVQIGFFGCRNAGKSSLVNAVTGQELAVVSQVMGTTTDPVQKAMELLPLGPVVIIDTPGIDDEGALGLQRIKKTRQVLNRVDVAVLVADARSGIREAEEELIGLFREKQIPFLVAYNKAELLPGGNVTLAPGPGNPNGILCLAVSAVTGLGIRELKEQIAALAVTEEEERKIVGDLLAPGDVAVLVVPIDKAAPKGRLILPQQQTIRDILDADAVSLVVSDKGLKEVFQRLGQKPRLVITDSQVFGRVSEDTPKDILLTSFSILFARYKGDLTDQVRGAAAIGRLQDKDRVLISEGCTHHRQCDDIGSVKLPGWLKEYTGKELELSYTSGSEFPEDLSGYRLVIHCGGCMLNGREMKYRMKCAKDQGVSITNYGIAIAQMNGILKRSLEPFPELLQDLMEPD